MLTTFSEQFWKQLFGAFMDRGASTVTVTMKMFGTDITINPLADKTQFVTAEYTASGAHDVQTVNFVGPSLDENGEFHLVIPPPDFSNDNTTDSPPLYGWVVMIDSAGEVFGIWMAEKFATPIVLPPGGILLVTPEIRVPELTGAAIIDR